MGILSDSPRLASAYTVAWGHYGGVTRYAQQRGVCRQWVYREAAWVRDTLDGTTWQPEIDRLRQRVGDLEAQVAAWERRLRQAVVVDRDKQAELACVGQARGVSLADLHALLEVLLPAGAPRVATLGRWTQAAGKKAGGAR